MIPGIFICSLFAHQAQIDLDTGGSRVIIWSHVEAVGVEFDGSSSCFFLSFLWFQYRSEPSGSAADRSIRFFRSVVGRIDEISRRMARKISSCFLSLPSLCPSNSFTVLPPHVIELFYLYSMTRSSNTHSLFFSNLDIRFFLLSFFFCRYFLGLSVCISLSSLGLLACVFVSLFVVELEKKKNTESSWAWSWKTLPFNCISLPLSLSHAHIQNKSLIFFCLLTYEIWISGSRNEYSLQTNLKSIIYSSIFLLRLSNVYLSDSGF